MHRLSIELSPSIATGEFVDLVFGSTQNPAERPTRNFASGGLAVKTGL